MSASEPKGTQKNNLPGIFISYRRSDSPDAVGRIYDRLVSEFGKARVFKDVDSIPLGQDFRGHLNDIVGGCAAVLAIIGPRWTDVRNEGGHRRLEDPDDFVRIELEAALARSVPVVPVLVGHAPMPGTSQLPATLASLAFRQSIEVRPDPDFHNDATRLVTALRQIIDPNARHETALATSAGPDGAASKHQHRFAWMAGLAAALALTAVVFAIPALKHLRETPPPETRTEVTASTIADARGSIALSPDGRQLVFVQTTVGVSRLWLRALAATTAQPLPGTEGASWPFWSPDGRSIGFFTSNALKRMDVGGGAPSTLTPVADGLGGSWNADGIILFAQGFGKALARIPATGGAVTQVTHLEKDVILHAGPLFLPDGHHFVYGSVGGNAAGTYLGSLDGIAPVRLSGTLGNLAYLPSGWLLVWDDSQRVLLAQRFDLKKAALVGAPVTLAYGSTSTVSASASGLVAYRRSASESGKRQLQWRSRSGAELGSIGEPDETYLAPRVSPDGRRVAVVRGETRKEDIWLLEGERTSRLTFNAAGNTYPVWSPDGSQIVFTSSRTDAPGLYQKPADGAGDEQVLLNIRNGIAPASWSADRRNLLYVYQGTGTSFDVGVLPMTGDRKPWPFLDSPFEEGESEFSPDGRWVAYESDETKQHEIYIRPFVAPGAAGATSAGRSGKWPVSTAGGNSPKWSPNGKELFFIDPSGEMMAAPIIVTGSALKPGTPVKLFQTRVLGIKAAVGPQYDVARDGRFLINVLDAAATESSPIILIQNWNPDAGK